MTEIPPPPVFKPTIIQMKGSSSQNLNSNILTTSNLEECDLMASKLEVAPLPSRKRRKSCQSFDSEELARKRKELKLAHSIIEKKRRIKMNREFEALKYLVPLCRTSILQSLTQPTPVSSPNLSSQQQQISSTRRNSSISSALGGDWESQGQMHKLTILQSTVEYISYLHHIIQLQRDEITSKYNPDWAQNTDFIFTEFELDLDQIRDIDSEYDFNKLFKDLIANDLRPLSYSQINSELKPQINTPVDQELPSQSETNSSSFPNSQSVSQLPSPLVTSYSDNNNVFKYKNSQNASRSPSSSSSSSTISSSTFQLPLPLISTKKKTFVTTANPLLTSEELQTPKHFKDDELSEVLLSIKDNKNRKSSISNLLN